MKHALPTLCLACLVALSATAQTEKTAGNMLDDSTVNASVKAALFSNAATPSARVNVETYKGIVLLSGFVDYQAQKDAAGTTAQAVSGVKQVHNAVVVMPPTGWGTRLDDSVLTGRVKSALIDRKDIESGQINVETRSGVVQLAGFVRDDRMRALALEVAAGVNGVRRVEDAMLARPE
jgi:hyperosmotically inducible protein